MIRTKPNEVLSKLCFSIILCGILFPYQSAWGSDFTADISAYILNSDATGKMYVADGRYRMDLKVQEKKMDKGPIIIVDRPKGQTILLNSDATTYDIFENFSFRAHMVDPFQAITFLEENVEKRLVGTDAIAGYPCDHYAFYDRDFKLADVWFARDLQSFPLKAHIVSGREHGSLTIKTNIGDTKLELSNIQEGLIDTTLFDVPQGFARETPSREVRKEKPRITETVEGAAPWGRRIGKDGEIQVRVDPRRPIKITLKNLVEKSICAYATLAEGGDRGAAAFKPLGFDKKSQDRNIEINKNKKTEWVFIRVEEGLVYATVANHLDPFAFSRDQKMYEGYLNHSVLESTGVIVDPDRKLTITVTGDSQDAPGSEVSVKCYRDSYKNKMFDKTFNLANGATKTWEFLPDRQVQTCEIGVMRETCGIKYCAEQPALAQEKKDVPQASTAPSKTQAAPKVVRTQPSQYGRSTKAPQKDAPSTGLDKTTSQEILKALNSGDVAAVKSHLDRGIDPNALVYGAPLLQKAANLSTADMVRLIIESGGDLRYKDRNGNDALFQAQSNTKNWQHVIPVLVEAGIEVNRNTPIWKIAFKTQGGKFKPGVQDTLNYLLSRGADVNMPISKNGNTLLMFAAKMAWLEPVQFYLDHGADINARDDKGNTALTWAKTERRGEQPYEQQNRRAIISLLESMGGH